MHTARDQVEANRALSPVYLSVGVGLLAVTSALLAGWEFHPRAAPAAVFAAALALLTLGLRDLKARVDVED